MYKKFAAMFFASTLLAPLAAVAQDVPSYADAQQGVERIQGRIASFDGQYDLRVRDERGFIDRVHIHPGTIINPTGITLAPGMVVSVIGENDGDYFSGDEIDTPYTIYGGVPYYQNHPWGYYGSGFALGFFFGSLGWWHGSYFSGYNYGWHNGYRYYNIPNYRIGAWGRPGGGYGYRGYGGGYGPHPAVYRNSESVRVNVYNGYGGHGYTGHDGYGGHGYTHGFAQHGYTERGGAGAVHSLGAGHSVGGSAGGHGGHEGGGMHEGHH